MAASTAGDVGRRSGIAPIPPCPALVPRAALGAVIGALLIDALALTLDLIRLRRLRSGVAEGDVGLDISSSLSSAANIVVPLTMLAAAVAFVWWFAYSYQRLAASGPTGHQPSWAVIGWLVPGLNLVRPPSIMAELVSIQRPSSIDRRGEILVLGWWLLWIEGMVIQVGLRFVTPSTNEGWTKWQGSALVSALVLVVAAGCAIALVAMVERQLNPPMAASKPAS